MSKEVLSSGATSVSRASGEIAYHYSYLQFGRVVRKGVLSSGATCVSRSSGEIAYHYHSFYLQFGRALRKGVLSSGTTRSSRIAYHYPNFPFFSFFFLLLILSYSKSVFEICIRTFAVYL